jgi:hypothetical protein
LYAGLAYQLCTALPMQPRPSGMDAVGQHIMHSATMFRETLQTLTNSQQIDREAAAAARAPSTFSDQYPTMAATIHRLCGTDGLDVFLPEFWQTYGSSKGKKAQLFINLQTLLNSRAMEENSAQVKQTLTPQMFNRIYTFQLQSTNVDSIIQGLSLFYVCPEGFSAAVAQEQANAHYMSLICDEGRASLQDIQSALGAGYNMPMDFLQMEDFIGAYSILSDVLFGVGQPLSMRLREHHRYWKANSKSVWANICHHEQLVLHVTTGVLRAVQLGTMNFINAQLASPMPLHDGPSFSHVEHAIDTRTWTLPQLPHVPDNIRRPLLPVMVPAATPAAQAPPVPHSPPAQAPARAPRVASAQNQVQNVAVRAPTTAIVRDWTNAYHAHMDRPIKTLKLIPEARNLTTDDGGHICLSYHLRGDCFENCGNARSHRVLSSAEAIKMAAFVKQFLP